MAEINVPLRSARLKQRWPVKTAARQAGVSETTYLRWEQGLQNPHLVNLQMLCDAFNLPPEKLGYANLVHEGEIEPGLESRQRKLQAQVEQLEELVVSFQRKNQLLERSLESSQREVQLLRAQTAAVSEQAKQIAVLETSVQSMQQRVRRVTLDRDILRKELAQAKEEIYLFQRVIEKAGINSQEAGNLLKIATTELRQAKEAREPGESTVSVDFLR